jgi:hypothetical protein
MTSTNVIRKKKMGRPRLGKQPAGLVAIRLPEEITKAVASWAKREGIKSQSAALRRLIERGLEK